MLRWTMYVGYIKDMENKTVHSTWFSFKKIHDFVVHSVTKKLRVHLNWNEKYLRKLNLLFYIFIILFDSNFIQKNFRLISFAAQCNKHFFHETSFYPHYHNTERNITTYKENLIQSTLRKRSSHQCIKIESCLDYSFWESFFQLDKLRMRFVMFCNKTLQSKTDKKKNTGNWKNRMFVHHIG